MKYPQLVSTRAVNAISDWLVSRLEQIGVEAPLIYSRLLLSLLHSSVQINDPIEFNNLETYLANRKGSKRVPPCDTETFKKITAVQCLVDAVSTEQEISKIENLVDELFEKLNDLEKQTNEEDLHHQLPTSLTSLDIEDPRKRYYRAFPALSKEMEDSVWLSKRNVKSLTWPTGNSGTSSSSMVALSNTAGVKRKTKRRRNQALSKGRVNSVRKNSCGENCSPTWDTDFEGNWEMGQDLIKEFLMSQKNRNRSISESDACNLRYEENFKNRMKPMQCDTVENYEILSADEEIKMDIIKDEKFDLKTVVRATKVNKPAEYDLIDVHDVNLMNDGDIEHDGYTAYDELTSPKEVDRTSNMARRLYQRDDISNNNSELGSLLSKQQNDFVQFEAKFNSSVEALWKTNTNDNDPSKLILSGGNTIVADNDVMNPTNVDNFWTSYYNHHYNDTDTDDQRPQQFCNSNITKTKNDFFSMPANFGKLTDSSDMHKKKVSAVGESLTSGGVFLRDSIWSDNSLSAQRTYDEDDSFYGTCWGSAIKLEGRNDIGDVKDLPNPFSISKWSECSFETPFIPSSASNEAVSHKTAAGLSAAKHDIRDNFLKNSYLCSSYKQTVAPATNKTASSLQQQSPQPISLPDFYGSLRLTEKDYNKSPSAASAVPVMPPQPSPVPTVSLTNHSKTSGFIQYSIVKSSIKIEPIAKIDRNNSRTMLGPPGLGATSSSTSSSASQPEEEENLLTSYRTHFRPIKQSYADGHQFDISGSLDEVDFDRSETGCLYLDSEKYFEYTRDDMFLSDEEPSVICSLSEERGRSGRANVKGLHPLKFRVKQIDKQCQTEDLVATASSIAVVDSIVLTPKKQNIRTSYDLDEVANSKDEVDFAGPDSDCYLNDETSIDLDQWSMAEIGKKCADNNNSHTLWGMCPACNKVNKCVPANRLLKDELIVEADEIMSDLKYMQDLYICSDWEDEDDDGNDTDDSELDALKHDDDSEVFLNEESADDDEEQEQIFYNITKLISDLLKPENAKSLVGVLGGANQGKNIFRGMYPEDEIPVSNVALHEHQKNVIWKNVNNNNNNNNINHNNNNNEKYIGGLWSNDENIIWKRELKPWGGNIGPRIHDNKGSTFLDKLNWKHGNLAEIWNSGAGGGGATEIGDDALPMPSSQSTVRNTDTPLLQNHHIDPKLSFNNRNMKNLISWNISQHYIDSESIAPPQRNYCYYQRISNGAATIVNRADRKRRHSASQNISCSGNHQCDGSGGSEWHGNNGMMAIGNKIEIMAKRELDYSKLSLIDDTSPATIITCKYWTTMDTTLASPYFMDKNSHYDGIGTMAMNPSSILKHVTVVSRPLTR